MKFHYLCFLILGISSCQSNDPVNKAIEKPLYKEEKSIQVLNEKKESINPIDTSTEIVKCPVKDLMGLWISDDDNDSQLRFDESNLYQIYIGDGTDTLSYIVSNKYPGIKNNPQTCYLIAEKRNKKDHYYYYEIMSLSTQRLTLMYLERGNILTYTKK